MTLTVEEIEEDWLQRMAVYSPGWVLVGAAAVLGVGLIGILVFGVGAKDRVITNLLLLATGAAELYLAKAFLAWAGWLGQPTEQRVTRRRMVILQVIGHNSLVMLHIVTVLNLLIIWLAGRIHPTVGHLAVLIAVAQYPVIGAVVVATAPRFIRGAYRRRLSRERTRITPKTVIITFAASMLAIILRGTTLRGLLAICCFFPANLYVLPISVAGLYQVYILGRAAMIEASQSQEL